MSEFTRKLREMMDRCPADVGVAALDAEEVRLFDALDARVRALEAKFVTTVGTFDQRLSNITSEMAGDYERDVERAVLAERERCARAVELFTCNRACKDDSHVYCKPYIAAAAEIRRGA